MRRVDEDGATSRRAKGIVVAAVLTLAVTQVAAAATKTSGDRTRVLRRVEQGLDSLRAGRLESAEKSFEKAIATDAESPEAYDGMGRVALGRKDYAGALDLFLTAREYYVRQAADRQREELEYIAALQQTQQAYQDIAGEMSQAGCLVETSLRRRLPDGARDLEDTARVDSFILDSLPAGLCFRTGVCLLRLGRVEAARAEFLNELSLNPGSRAANINLAVCELTLGNPAEALFRLDQAVVLGAVEPEGLQADILALLDTPSPTTATASSSLQPPSQAPPPEIP